MPIPHFCLSKFYPFSNDILFLQISPVSHYNTRSFPIVFPYNSHLFLSLWPQLYLPYQQSANTLRVVIGPFSAFQAQIVCIQQALTPYFLSWRDWDLCAWLSFCRVCWAAPWNVFRNPEAKNISPKQPQWLPCREQDLADEAEGLCPPGGVPPSNLQMPFLEERSLFSPCKCLLGLVPHWQ